VSKREALDPSYSPNGKRIAYAGYAEKDWEIYTNTVGGRGKVKLTDNTTSDTDPSWGSRP
jgi:Tol biopolymer transport system component